LWFIFGYRDCRRIESRATETIMAQFRSYYAAVPRFVREHLHRMGAFATGRTRHKGVLISIDLTKRCDPFGFLWTCLWNQKSLLIFEFLVDPDGEVPGLFHISGKEPGFAKTFKLTEYSVSEARLKCFTDLGDHRHMFLPLFNQFMEAHPRMLKLVEISDVNRFQLLGECRFVVRLEFQFRTLDEEFVFSREIVDFAMTVADKFATVKMDAALIARNNKTRQTALVEIKGAEKK
jgi:hypothetical protein